MTSLKELKRIMEDSRLIVTKPYRNWLLTFGESGYSPEIAEWIGKQLAIRGRDRTNSFSASAAGACRRAQTLQYIAAPHQDGSIDAVLQNLFNDGKWRHLRWQAALFEMGILTKAEVPLLWPKKRMKGSADGLLIVPDDHPNVPWRGEECGFELKGMSPWPWQALKTLQDDGAEPRDIIKPEHLSQVSTYALISGWNLFCIVYENKATQEWMEFVIDITQDDLDAAQMEIDLLNEAIDSEELPEVIDACKGFKGDTFKGCPFGGNRFESPCAKAGTWPSERLFRSWQS